VNLGNPQEITIRELADRIVQRIKPGLGVIHEPLPIDDPQRRRPCIDRAETLLGWRPVVDLGEGLEATIHNIASELKQLAVQAN
jgi:UDP-glucuronate decarboxylase